MTDEELVKRDMEHTYMMGYIYASINEIIKYDGYSTSIHRIDRLKELKSKMSDFIMTRYYSDITRPVPEPA